MRDRTLEKRLGRATEESDRLRFENDMLREEVEQTRGEHHRILDMIETKLASPAPEVEVERKSHKGRWLMFLMALGGGAYAVIRMRSQGNGHGEWSSMGDTPTGTESRTAAI
jgi:hypothetical protein